MRLDLAQLSHSKATIKDQLYKHIILSFTQEQKISTYSIIISIMRLLQKGSILAICLLQR